LQIPAVEDEQDREQALVGTRADERVLAPCPGAMGRERRLFQPEAPARHDARAQLVGERERGQEIDRRLMVADRGEHARQQDFNGTLGTLTVAGRLLDMPDAAALVAHDHSGIDPALLRPDERVRGRWIGSAAGAPGSEKQIGAADVWWLP